MNLNDKTPLPVTPSPTSQLIRTLTRLLGIAKDNGITESALILAHIGDVKGIRALDTMATARVQVAEKFQQSRVNLNGYPPYPGLPALRAFVAKELLTRLGIAVDEDALRPAGVLESSETAGDLAHIGSGSVCCSGSLYAHCRYLRQKTGRENVNVAVDVCHYWKHQGVGVDMGTVKVYAFMRVQGEGSDTCLMLDSHAVREFGEDGGGVLMINFGNPCNFLPRKEDAEEFAAAIVSWNVDNPSRRISVVIDSPYDDFDYEDNRGYRFASILFKAGVTTSYCHARTKEEFATGSRLGEVLSNHPYIRAAFTDYKADYIGSDSRVEQEIALLMHEDKEKKEEEKRDRMQRVRERKRYFWSLLGEEPSLSEVLQDTRPFYREEGAFYLFLNVRMLMETQGMPTSLHFCEHLATSGIILVPGVLFDINPSAPQGFNKTCVRISFAAFAEDSWKQQMENIVKALVLLTRKG